MSELYRALPAVDALLAHPRLAGLPRGVVVAVAREVLSELRAAIAEGARALPDVPATVEGRARTLLEGRSKAVFNATGVVVHTNLGRAPWAPEARQAALRAMGACNLEMDLATGERGGRMAGIPALLRHLTGCEDALVVNNGAAALLLALTALAAGREVIVSRGQLVEIGGSLRIPEVVASCGAVLREVGATNRTRLADIERAIGERTGAILVVHPSNFRMVGFVEQPGRRELAGLARARGVPLVEDLGSGAIADDLGEPSVGSALAEGSDLVTFSGDKLLGGPQAGVIAGRSSLVARCASHPLTRALRVDKVTIAALEATLALHAAGGRPPVSAMILASREELLGRASRLRDGLLARGVPCALVEEEGAVGGGALPGVPLPGPVVALEGPAEPTARALRAGAPPVVGRTRGARVLLDPRTLPESAIDAVIDAVVDAIGRRDRMPP